MGKGFSYIRGEKFIKEIGLKIKNKAQDFNNIKIMIFIKDYFLKENLMVMEFIIGIPDKNMKEIGLME